MKSNGDRERITDFWGIPGSYSLRGFEKVSSEGGLCLASRETLFKNRVLELKFNREIMPEWIGANERIPVFINSVYKNRVKGEVLAYFIDGSQSYPAITREDSRIVYSFDPEETIFNLMREKYFVHRRSVSCFLPFHYHRVPGKIRVAINKIRYALRKPLLNHRHFPAWPVEKSVEAIRCVFLKTLRLLDGNEISPLPFWPENKKYCAVLTHDVDTREGFLKIKDIASIEEGYHLTSAWNFVVRCAEGKLADVDRLWEDNHEIGCHEFNHDNKIAFLNPEEIRQRFLNSAEFLNRYRVSGFRSPSLLRTGRLFAALPEFFSYDSSIPDTEVFSPISNFNGACTIFPFRIGRLWELPLTVPQDAVLLALGLNVREILGLWLNKIEFIKRLGGLAVINTHTESYYSGNKDMLGIYERLLGWLSDDKDVWIAKPKEVIEWWSRRSKISDENNTG